MTISTITPVYNQAEYLPATIESILSQSEPAHEIIIIDDGSTDNSLEIALDYSKQYELVKVIHQVNKGLASARNTGIMNATGDYVLPLDADDMLLESCIRLISEKNTDIIAPSFKCFGVDNSIVILKDGLTVQDFLTANRIGYFSAIKRSALLEIGGYSPRMIYGYEDLHLWINLLSRGASIITIQEPLVLYRTKEHSMIHDAQAHHLELMEQIKKDFPQLYG